MKILASTLLFVLAGRSWAQEDCPVVPMSEPMVIDLEGIETAMFSGVKPRVLARVEGPPAIKVLGYSGGIMPLMQTNERTLMITREACDEQEGSAASWMSCAGAALGVAASTFFVGASPATSLGLGFFSAMASSVPGALAQDGCQEVLEIEIHGPMVTSDGEDLVSLQSKVADLEAQIAALQADAEGLLTTEEAEQLQYQAIVDAFALGDYDELTPESEKSLGRISNGREAQRYDVAGFSLYNDFNPEAQFYLANAGDDSLVRDMQGDIFQFPENGNDPADVPFPLPPVPDYTGPSDLYYMPIMQIAALIESQTVSCATVVDAFISRLAEFDPYLAIVATPLYDKAREMATSHDALIASGTYLSPLMCIPFGVKDHHQIDDEPTMYGHLGYPMNVQKTKSTMMKALLDAGAIPIAKTMLGTYAFGSTHAWGECMSPYLNGNGCGSSCGSGSGAALGALPFAVSEETSGSIACPSSASLISGHIGSYGSFSRAGAGLLCSETDHLGFHTRYLSDFGVVFNYARTGDDPLDGDSVKHEFVNPSDVDLSSLRVLIIEGSGEWEYSEERERWQWNNGVRQSYSKTAWHWPERVAAIKEKLDAAGVAYDSMTQDAIESMWSFNETTPYFDCADPQINVMMASGPWAQAQECEFCFANSKWTTYTPANVPVKSYRYLQYCMKEIGKKYLNDPIWGTYDVIIETHSSIGGGYDSPGGSFEQWVRTAKTFVMDYYEALPCASQQGDTVEGSYTVLTAKPFEDYKNFAIGQIIQDPAAIIFPNDEAIKTAFEGRERCPSTFYAGINDILETCPPLNSDGAPPGPSLRGMDNGCVVGATTQHVPDEFGAEPYAPPYEMDDMVPDRAIWKWDIYGPVACTSVCPFLPTLCEYKGIVCDERRLAEEKEILKKRKAEMPVDEKSRKLAGIREAREWEANFQAMLESGGEL